MKKNKIKILVIALLLFTITGTVGYGVYSYYFTEGSYSTPESLDGNNNTIYLNGKFSPRAGSSYSANFLSGEHDLNLTCGEINTSTGIVECTGSVDVFNNGSSDIYVEVNDNDSYAAKYGDHFTGDPSYRYSWTNTTISPNSYESLTVTTTAHVEIGTNDSNPQEVTDPVIIDEDSIRMHLYVRATQVR